MQTRDRCDDIAGVGPVVILTPWFPNRPGERIGAFIYESAAALAGAGIPTFVVVCRPAVPRALDGLAPEWTRGQIDTAAFGMLDGVTAVRYFAIPGGYMRPVTNRMQRARTAPALLAAARSAGASLIHAHTEGMAPIARDVADRLGIPAVTTIHGLNTDARFLHSRGQKALLSSALRGMNRIILVGESSRLFFRDYMGREDHIRIVPNGVNFPERERTEPILESSDVRLVSVSNLHEGKGVDITLDALAMLDQGGMRNWSYCVIGGGYGLTTLAARAGQLGLGDRVRFVGLQPSSTVFDTLLRSDVFVLPSWREAFGIVYLEAMACGLATIGVRGQGPQSFIENGSTGYLVEPRSARDVADCLARIFDDRLSAQQVGLRAKSAARQFSWNAHAARLAGVYREAMAP